MSNAQASTGVGEVCRLTICGPSSRIELGVPAHVPIADLLPTFLGHLGPELANAGLEHGGWVLQRVGEPPLDEELGTAGLGLYDGDVLHLRPRDEQLPPAAFDDLIDGVATGITTRRTAWRPADSAMTFLAFAGLAMVTALVVTLSFAKAADMALATGVVAVVALAAAAVSSRAIGDVRAARLFLVASAAFSAISGAALPLLGKNVGSFGQLISAPGMAAASAGVLAVAVLGRFAVDDADAVPALAATMFVAGLGLVGGVLRIWLDLSAAGAASVVIVLVLIIGVRTPLLSTQMAGVRVPPLPTTTDEFQTDLDPEPSTEVLERTARADRYLTTLHIGLGAVAACCLAVVVQGPGWAPLTLAAVIALLLVLHARDLMGIWQRLPVLVAAAIGGAAIVLALPRNVISAAGLVVLALLLFYASRKLPGRRMLAHWGRAGDIFQTVLAVAVVPIALEVLDLYSRMRGVWD